MIERTPQVYIDMNKEFIEEDTPFRLTIPTQQQINNASNLPEDYEQHDHTYTDSEIELHFGSEYESGIDYE